MVSDTLLIRHLPVLLRTEEIREFLKHLGAIQVFIHESKLKKYNYAFAKFKNELVARETLMRIHQKEILDSRLIVEFVDSGYVTQEENEEKIGNIKQEENKKTKMREMFLRNLNNWTVGLNLTLPPPYHLKYRYPVPNSLTIFNIANMLCCNVKFYTQVIHLMNKMNLPSPFESHFSLRENEVFNSFLTNIFENVKSKSDAGKTEENTGDSSEKESELESENEDKSVRYSRNTTPFKRKSVTVEKFVKRKRMLMSTIPALSKTNKTLIEDVFEQVKRENATKKIEVKIETKNAFDHHHAEIDLLDRKPEESKSQDVSLMYVVEKMGEQSTQKEDEIAQDGCIPAEELASNRISERDWQILPFFKNYHAGTPCCRLYLKNLAKHVVASDLNYIFSRYSASNSCEPQTMFNIRLMQEGRMKGQAFVTLPTVELAELALKETNGYILKGKPMVVQFAKTPVVKIYTENSKE